MAVAFFITCSTMIMMVIIVVINQGREGLGGGVPPNHMWTPYGFVPFQMGAGGQQVIPLLIEQFIPNLDTQQPNTPAKGAVTARI